MISQLKILGIRQVDKACSMSISRGSHEAVSSPQSHFIKSFTCHPPASPAQASSRLARREAAKMCRAPLLLAPVRPAGQCLRGTAGHRLTALKYHEQRQQPDRPTLTTQSRTFKLSVVAKFKPTDCKL